jgi:endonuclease YncB( thermonuclease family)
MRPKHIPDHAERVGDIWIWGDGSAVDRIVYFEEDPAGGVEGWIDGDGITLEVEAVERGHIYSGGDTPKQRTLPIEALRRALAMYDDNIS